MKYKKKSSVIDIFFRISALLNAITGDNIANIMSIA